MVKGIKLSDEELCKVVDGGAKTITQEKPADGVEEWQVDHASAAQQATEPLLLSVVKKIKNLFATNIRKPITIIS